MDLNAMAEDATTPVDHIPQIEVVSEPINNNNPDDYHGDDYDYDDDEEPPAVDDDDEKDVVIPRRYRVSHVEVFSVRINNNSVTANDDCDDDDEEPVDDNDEEEPPADIYGTITIFDSFHHHQDIFTRKKGDYDTFLPNIDTELLLCSSSSSSVLDTSYVTMTVLAIMNDDGNIDDSSLPYSTTGIHNSLSHRGLRFCIGPDYHITLDRVFTIPIFGEFGSVTVQYIMFNDAIRAYMEITLLNTTKDNDDDYIYNVYGRITARNSIYSESKSLIFRRHKGLHVIHGDIIPLSRSLVTVPYESSLIISADLLGDCDGEIGSIANGDAEFHVSQVSGTTSEKIISGRHGEILVKVTWRHLGLDRGDPVQV